VLILLCPFQGVGWWKYEFCYGKHVHQYHEVRLPLCWMEQKLINSCVKMFFIYCVIELRFGIPGQRARKEHRGGGELERRGAHRLVQEERRPILPAQR